MTNVLHIGLDNTSNIGDQAISKELGDMFQADLTINYMLFPLNYTKYSNSGATKDVGSIKARVRKIKWVKFCYELIAPVLHYKYYKDLSHKLTGQDVVVIGGGNIVMDIDILFPIHLLIISKLVKIKKVNCGLLVAGVGPVETRIGNFICKRLLKNCNFAILRDEKSSAIVSKLHPSLRSIVLPDPVFIKPQIEFTIEKDREGALICVFPYGDSRVSRFENLDAEKGYIDLICRLYDQIVLAGFTNISILVSDRERDINIATKLKTLRNFSSLIIPKSVTELEDTIKKSCFLLSTRMHPAIIAAKFGIPFHCLAWQDKVLECFKVVGLENKITDIRYLDKNDRENKSLFINDDEFTAKPTLNINRLDYFKTVIDIISK